MSDFNVSQVGSRRESRLWRDQAHVRAAGYALLLGIAYYFGAKLGFALTFHPHPVSTLWPSNAILLAALLLAPPALWWVLVLGTFLAHLAVQLQSGVPTLMALCWFISNAGEALIGAFCIRRFDGGVLRLDSFRSVSIFAAFAGFLGPLITSFLDAGFVTLIGWGQDSYWLVWRMRLLANVLGALTLIPVIVVVGRGDLAHLLRAGLRRYVKAGLFTAGLLMSGVVAFHGRGVPMGNVPVLVYAPMPFLLWAAVCSGPAGVSASLLVTALMAIWGTVHGRGPFTTLSPTENVFSLQLFLIMMTVPLMFLAALIEERRRVSESLRESEERYRAFFELTAVGAGEANPADGRFLRVNQAHCRITGYSREELLGMSFIEITHPEDRLKDLEEFRRLIRGEVTGYRNEKRYLRKDGRVAWVQVDVSLLRDGKGQPLHTVAIVQDITERKRAESRLGTQYALSRVLSESASIAEAAPQLIQSACKLLDWKLGELWVLDRPAGHLTCLESWHEPSNELAEFASASRGLTFAPGVGLPGRVWKNAQPAWITDILSDSNFPRPSLAAQAGLRSALGFPILFGGEVLGVMVFISHEAREPDEDLLRMTDSIGSQIGQFIEQKRAEESLRRSERNLRDFFQNATVGLHWAGSDGIILRANQAELDLLGYAREEYVGHHIAEFHSDPEVADDFLRRLAAGESLTEYAAQLRRKDGTVRHVLISANVLWEGGRFVHSRCFTRDITERKHAVQALQESEERFRNMADTAPVLIWMSGPDKLCTYFNKGWLDFTGRSIDRELGVGWGEGVHPDDYERCLSTYSVAFDARQRFEIEYRLRRYDGEYRWIVDIGVPRYTPDGSFHGYIGSALDITERKRLEDEVRYRARELATLVENSPDIIARVGRALRFVYVNPAAERVFGIPAEQFIGRSAPELNAPSHDWQGFEASCRLAFASRITVVRDFSHNGRYLQTRFIPELGDDDSVDSVMCISQDVTERKRAEGELQRLSERLLDLQDEERRRIARELHDGTAQNLFAISIDLAKLQQPALLLGSEGKDTLAECQALCEQSLQEIRTLSYLLHPPLLDQTGLVSALKWFIDGFAKRSGIDIGLVVTDEIGRLPRQMETDLFRVVQEALANVHRHSGSRTATVRLERQGEVLILQVEDQGHGMLEPLVARPQGAGSLGVGILGMRQRLREHGGKLEIDSGGQGTTVRATVPLFVKRRSRARTRHAGA